MTGLDELEDGIAVFDDLLRQLGVSGELRAELSDQLREIVLLPPGDPGKVMGVLGLSVKVLPFLEADLRAFGREAFADQVARFTVALSLWLEMPADLVWLAGCRISKTKERKYERPLDHGLRWW